jgi:hypothetical protein
MFLLFDLDGLEKMLLLDEELEFLSTDLLSGVA